MGHDPTHSNTAAENSITNTDSVACIWLLTALATAPDWPSNHVAHSIHRSTQVNGHDYIPDSPLHIYSNIFFLN